MESSKKILQANANFTNNLYKMLSKREGNIFFSPISVHVVLAMLYQGAKGHTAQVLLNSLQCADPEGYKAVLDHLNGIEHVRLMMANKIYGNSNKNKLVEDFETKLRQNFGSEVEFLDVSNKQTAAKTVNSWVEKKTDSKIKNIVNEQNFDKNLSLMLINAIYFKGRWASQFQESLTRKSDFFLDKSNKVEVEMMYQKAKYAYKYDKDLDSQIIEIPYRGLNTHMMVILPSEDSNIKDLEAKLSTDFPKILKDLKVEDVHLYLPKFKIEETIKLNNVLSEMGLGDIFDMKKANFGGMIEESTPLENLFVSEIIQKAYIQVNETGTEAAAATKAGMMVGCAPGIAQPVIFKVNRPAIFMVVASHGDERSFLFYGRLSQPHF